METAPDVFELDEEDKARVIDPDGDDRDTILDAAMNCPVSAIFVFSDEGELYP